MTAWFQTTFLGEYGGWIVANLILCLLIALPIMLSVALVIYGERKLWAAFALRRGPNVVGPLGVLQSFADGLKVFLQETIVPTASNRGLFLLAPVITFTVALIVWAVIPFQAGVMLADINVGLLYILAASSLGVYGVIIAGWASNSKYPFYSALRAAAQMVSYEVSIGFILISVVLWTGSFNLSAIVEAQKSHVWIINGFGFNPLLFPMAVLFFISSLAETARAPFDLTEAESELVAGYQTEYSSMAFAMYWLGEYANVILMCVLNAVLFWGGYLPPIDWAPLYVIPGFVWLFLKFLLFFFLFAWVKATVPRYRYDQLMRLGWKVFLPISLFWVFLVSGYLMLTRYGPEHRQTAIAKAFQGGDVGDIILTSYQCGMLPGTGETFQMSQTQTIGAGTTGWEFNLLHGVDTISGIPFAARTGSIGGSEGIQYRDANGDLKRAYVSFSDIVGDKGPAEVWVAFDAIDSERTTTCRPLSRDKIGKSGNQS
jgi:NADH-quinone oxidoreductase subunit H